VPLSLATGAEVFPGPGAISGSSQGVTFDPLMHMIRPGLLTMNETIYSGSGSHCDFSP
jgi:hypothetical protein